MEENRKLVFSKEVEIKEGARVKRFKAIIILALIICIIIVPIVKVNDYNRIKARNQTYINMAMDIWYNGINNVKYTKLEISILDDNIKYEDIYKMGINSIGPNKLQISVLIDNNYWIIQKENTVKIKDNHLGNIAKLEFDESNVKIINQNIIRDILMSVFLIFMLICISIAVINAYEENGKERIIKDMQKLSDSEDYIF